MKKMTENQKKILDYLWKNGGYVSPTQIGAEVGGVTASGLKRHSAWASPICKTLVKMGAVARSENGHYKALMPVKI